MSDDEMRVAIAEACGWKEHPSKQGWIWLGEQPQPSGLNQPPDYPNDLNAMHEVEKALTNAQRRYYPEALIAVHPLHYDPREKQFGTEIEDDTAMKLFLLVNMTAAQRAEAFLRTIGKWL